MKEPTTTSPSRFASRKCVARLRALIRRASRHPDRCCIAATLTLDPGRRRVTCDGMPIRLTSLEFRLLSYLMHNHGRVVAQAEALSTSTLTTSIATRTRSKCSSPASAGSWAPVIETYRARLPMRRHDGRCAHRILIGLLLDVWLLACPEYVLSLLWTSRLGSLRWPFTCMHPHTPMGSCRLACIVAGAFRSVVVAVGLSRFATRLAALHASAGTPARGPVSGRGPAPRGGSEPVAGAARRGGTASHGDGRRSRPRPEDTACRPRPGRRGAPDGGPREIAASAAGSRWIGCDVKSTPISRMRAPRPPPRRHPRLVPIPMHGLGARHAAALCRQGRHVSVDGSGEHAPVATRRPGRNDRQSPGQRVQVGAVTRGRSIERRGRSDCRPDRRRWTGNPGGDARGRLRRGVRADQAVPGSGLGLAIVRELAELYGGSLALGQSPEGGCRAQIALPRAVPVRRD